MNYKELLKKNWKFIALAGALIITVGYIFLSRNNDDEFAISSSVENDILSSSVESFEEEVNNIDSASTYYVDIKGAVVKPGVYQFSGDTRVTDVVDMAGGFLADADQTQVNLAQKVTDQMVIYIPKEGENIDSVPEIATAQSETISENGAEADDKVNINTADMSMLQTLNGIGEKKAQAIIAYREENGSFKTIEDIKNVSGIGEKIFESLKDYITI